MKHFYSCLALLLLLPVLPAVAQNPASCCHAPSDMAAFAADPAFQLAHPLPEPFAFTPRGESVTFPAPDGKPALGYALKAAAADAPVLLVYHEWWGLNAYIRQEVELWFAALDGKVTVMAPDLYDGEVADTRQKASSLMQGVTEDRASAIVRGAFAWAGTGTRLASIGWCFGGGWSLKSALLAGERAKACVMYYGMPVTDTVLLKPLQTDVLGIFAGKEKWISPQVVADFQQAMLATGKTVTVHSFPAEHAFANPSNPSFAPEAAGQARALALAYLQKRLLE